MNWIRLLYPAPQIEVAYGPRLFRFVHKRALRIAFYISHTIAIVALVILFFSAIVPLKIWAFCFSKDLLEEEFPGKVSSYLKKSETIEKNDFQRMY